MFSYLAENFPFHCILQHFSPFYIFCIAVSVVTVMFTWYFNDNTSSVGLYVNPTIQRTELPTESDKYRSKNCFHVVSQVKRAEQKALEKYLKEELTEEQLAEEKETERKQLSEIFKLLKEQEDKFHINSQEELQEQLRLYRSQ